MDDRQFDELARRFAAGVTRRRLVRGLAAGTLAVVISNSRRGTGFGADARAANDACAQFCRQLPPGPDRGRCVSDAAHGQGLCSQCGPAAPPGTAQQLCGTTCADTTSDAANCGGCGIVCATGEPCVAGQCGCGPGGAYCAQTRSCVSTFCGIYRYAYNPATCACACQASLITLPGGGCGIPCSSDADCSFATLHFGTAGNFCGTTEEGLKVCVADQTFSENPNCSTSAQCYDTYDHGTDTFCVAGLCRGAL